MGKAMGLHQASGYTMREVVQNVPDVEMQQPKRGKAPGARTPSPRPAPWLRSYSPLNTREIRRYGMSGNRVDAELTRNHSRKQMVDQRKNATSDHTWTEPMDRHDPVSLRVRGTS